MEVLEGNPNAVVQSLEVTLTKATRTGENTVELAGEYAATVLPTENANENAAKTSSGTFSGATATLQQAGSADSIPVGFGATARQTQTCDILFLDLGPIDLLGLVRNLSEVTLDLDARQSSGNLLGNLLCAVVNLRNPQ